jgi:hypothetical protein
MSKDGKSLNEALKPKLGISCVRRSFHSYYAIFEIQDKGLIKMVYPKLENGNEHTFKTREEAIEWLVDYADDFRRYFIMEQITVY